MKNSMRALSCSLIFCFFLLLIDRLTKAWALTLAHEMAVNEYLSFKLVFNRGISWGFFNSDSSMQMTVITAGVVAIAGALLVYMWHRFKEGHGIFPELLVLTGAFSNIVDRFYYRGVIDFVLLTYHEYSWPIFNIADAVILIGITLMLVQHMKDQD